MNSFRKLSYQDSINKQPRKSSFINLSEVGVIKLFSKSRSYDLVDNNEQIERNVNLDLDFYKTFNVFISDVGNLNKLINECISMNDGVCTKLRFCSAVTNYLCTEDICIKRKKRGDLIRIFFEKSSIFYISIRDELLKIVHSANDIKFDECLKLIKYEVIIGLRTKIDYNLKQYF